MPRVRRGTKKRKRRAKILKLAKGYWGARSHNYRTAKEAVERALQYAYRDRRTRKRDFRRLWIIRVKAAAENNGISYSRFINGLKKSDIEINRKLLSEIAVNDSEGFARLADIAREAL